MSNKEFRTAEVKNFEIRYSLFDILRFSWRFRIAMIENMLIPVCIPTQERGNEIKLYNSTWGNGSQGAADSCDQADEAYFSYVSSPDRAKVRCHVSRYDFRIKIIEIEAK